MAALVSPVLCAPYLAQDCSRELKALLDAERPRNVYSLSVAWIDVVKEVLTDPSYQKGMATAGLKVLDRVKAAKKGESIQGNILDDLIDSYRESGLSQEAAEDHAWKTMAVYATRGAAVDALDNLTNHENGVKMLFLRVLASGMRLLDLHTPNKNGYSLPPSVKSSCSFARSYHFWMAAWSARWLSQKFPNRNEAAVAAAHISELLYQFGYQSSNKDHNREKGIDPFSPGNTSVRISIAQADSGAKFGANWTNPKTKNKVIDQDSDFRRMMQESKPFPEDEYHLTVGIKPVDQFLGFIRWKEALGVDQGLIPIKTGNPL